MAGLKDIALYLTVLLAGAALAASDAQAQWGFSQTSQARPQAQAAPPPGPPPQSVSRGENFSAKPPAQLFASDCTGSGCHKGPQGLSKDRSQGGLAGFLREHYTNSRESAAALAAYLTSVPSDARAARPERQPRAAARSDETAKPAEESPRTRRPAAGEQGETAKPAAKPPRGRQAIVAPAPPAPAPEPPEPPAAPAAPPPPKWDIFD